MTKHLHAPACCGFCGLLCDDLTVEADGSALTVTAAGCERSQASFTRISRASADERAPRIRGQAVELPAALKEAAGILQRSRLPLFAGLGTDVLGMRGLMELADRCGAVLDHMNAEAKFRNILTVQSNGWITTTFSELSNRADLVLMIGTDGVSRFPRFFERLVWPGEALFTPDLEQRRVVYLGPAADRSAGTTPKGVAAQALPCNAADMPDVIAALRAQYNGRRIDAAVVGGLPVEALRALADQLRSAQYAVLVWVAPDLSFSHAELTTQAIAGLLADINETTRAAGLPLGGNDGDFSADAVLLWQSGFPFRTSFASGQPDYDPRLFSAEGVLERGEADALLWVSSLDSQRPRLQAEVPAIVLASAGTPVDPSVDVWIPVATPGVDAAGHMVRADKILILPLQALVATGMPTVQAVARGLLQQMEPAQC
jgi:formylmethanofuran dehydrogenase subunit B